MRWWWQLGIGSPSADGNSGLRLQEGVPHEGRKDHRRVWTSLSYSVSLAELDAGAPELNVHLGGVQGCPRFPMCSVTRCPMLVCAAESNAFFTSILIT